MRHKTMAIAGAVLGMSLVATACDVPFGFGEQQAVESYDVTDKVAVLDARTGSGDVVVREGDRSGVHVTETLHWRGDKPADGHSVDGDTLTLKYKCDNCSVDYEVEVPRGLTMKIDSGSGDITLRDLTGQVNASTGSGDVEARGLAAAQVNTRTGSGDITLRFSAVPADVQAVTGSGDGRLWVPNGAYKVNVSSGSGDRTVEVPDDASAPNAITVRTGSGDAEVHKL
ncbi:DUF4097 family beta strand repeat-containing protein [Microbispora bryophytorum]|uniref:DUF4097 family beta strand repeat-containing protein n=1 Tax=Microbispora bryophytorum TaxID=1460882 RepID=UPI0033FEB07A